MKSVASVAGKWVRGLQNAGPSMQEGANGVTVAPGQKAAAAVELYKRKVIEAADSGRFASAAAAVSLESWRADYIGKGISRATSAATQAKPKVERFLTFWLPICQQASEAVAAMPKGSLEDSKARMLRNLEILSGNKYKGRR